MEAPRTRSLLFVILNSTTSSSEQEINIIMPTSNAMVTVMDMDMGMVTKRRSHQMKIQTIKRNCLQKAWTK